MFASKLTIGLATAASLVAAQTSLYVPGFDPQAISISVGGTDSEGRTTYVLSPGQATDDSDAFYGTATLVEGTSDVSLTYVIPEETLTMGEYCTVANGVANCVVNVNSEAFTTTEAVSDLALQGGGAGATNVAAATTTTTGAPGATATSSGFSTQKATSASAGKTGAASGASATSGSASATSTSSASDASRLTAVSTLGLAGLAGVFALFF